MGVKTFMLEHTGEFSIELRRYVSLIGGGGECSVSGTGYHNAQVPIPERGKLNRNGYVALSELEEKLLMDKYDSQFPKQCACGYEFTDDDQRQLFNEALYRRQDNGELTTIADAPAGAMWNGYWMAEHRAGPDGLYLMVKVPSGEQWAIDERASNCDMPCLHCGIPYKDHKLYSPSTDNHHYEDLRPHKCWIRHGTPPNITVDKNGVTCGAGAGSIQTHDYHGFLINGEFT